VHVDLAVAEVLQQRFDPLPRFRLSGAIARVEVDEWSQKVVQAGRRWIGLPGDARWSYTLLLATTRSGCCSQ